MAEVSTIVVEKCVKHLILLRVAGRKLIFSKIVVLYVLMMLCLVLVPVFQYSNIYRPTPKLKILAKSREVQERAIEKCSKSQLKKAKVRDILLLFASMTHGATLGTKIRIFSWLEFPLTCSSLSCFRYFCYYRRALCKI